MTQATLLHEPDSVEGSMIETFHELAEELHLPELHWDFVHAHNEVIVEGRPYAPSDYAACLRWAHFLNMRAIGSEEQVAGCRWLGINGPWTLEIIAEVG